MTLQERLDAYKAQFVAGAPPAAVALMRRATEELRQSAGMERVLKVGDPAPAFRLPDAEGKTVDAGELLADRPLVVSFYRGVW